MSYVIIANGNDKMSSLSAQTIQGAALMAVSHPKHQHLYHIAKSRHTQPSPRLVTHATLAKHIQANLV